MRSARTAIALPWRLPDHLLAALLALPREVVSRLIERMIDHLDEIDGDPDLEDDDPTACEARDDGCGPVTVRGRVAWGTSDDDQTI